MLRQLVSVIVLLGALSSTSFASSDGDKFMDLKYPQGGVGGPQLHTNIALVGAEHPVTTIHREQPNVLVDPSKLFDTVSEEYRKTDIEEDPEDRFVTTRSGKPRVQLVNAEEDWADESPLTAYSGGQVLIRKKRCGGGDDDDGNANRARSVRRRRQRQVSRQRRVAKKARRAARKAARGRTTTITRTIIPANQLASYPAVQPANAQMYVQQQQPGQVIQTVQMQPGTVQQLVPAQVITQQPQVQFQGQAVASIQPMGVNGAMAAAASS